MEMTETTNNYFRAGDANWNCGHKHKTLRKAIKCRNEERTRRAETASLIGNRTEPVEPIRLWEFIVVDGECQTAKEVKPATDDRWPQNLPRV